MGGLTYKRMKDELNQLLEENRADVEEAFNELKAQVGKVLLAFVALYLETVKEDKDEEYLLAFCDKLNQLSITY